MLGSDDMRIKHHTSVLRLFGMFLLILLGGCSRTVEFDGASGEERILVNVHGGRILVQCLELDSSWRLDMQRTRIVRSGSDTLTYAVQRNDFIYSSGGCGYEFDVGEVVPGKYRGTVTFINDTLSRPYNFDRVAKEKSVTVLGYFWSVIIQRLKGEY